MKSDDDSTTSSDEATSPIRGQDDPLSALRQSMGLGAARRAIQSVDKATDAQIESLRKEQLKQSRQKQKAPRKSATSHNSSTSSRSSATASSDEEEPIWDLQKEAAASKEAGLPISDDPGIGTSRSHRTTPSLSPARAIPSSVSPRTRKKERLAALSSKHKGKSRETEDMDLPDDVRRLEDLQERVVKHHQRQSSTKVSSCFPPMLLLKERRRPEDLCH